MFDFAISPVRILTARLRPHGLRTVLSGAVLSAGLLAATSPVMAQSSDMQILIERMERMERDIRTLNQQIARGATAPAQPGASAQPLSPTTSPPAKIEFNEGEGALARMNVRLGAMEQEVRQITGLTEGMNYRIDQLNARLDKLIGDLDFRLGRLEGGASMGSLAGEPAASSAPMPSAMPSPPGVSKLETTPLPSVGAENGTVSKDGTYVPPEAGSGTLGQVSQKTLQEITETAGMPAPENSEPAADENTVAAASSTPSASSSLLPEGTPRERYQFAFGLMSQARYDEAEAAFKEFITLHGDDQLAGNARYWLGESYYVRKAYMEAAQTFFQAYQTQPDGPKAPDSLLKLGMSMGSLDKTEEACATYGKLRKEFADLKPTIEKNLNREVKRLKCQ